MLSIEDRVVHVLEDFVLQGCDINRLSTWEELGLDSVDKVEFLMNIEDEFETRIEDEVMTMLDTVEDLVKFLEKIL